MVSRSGQTPLECRIWQSGDYVLIHAGQVLDRISAEEAEEILALYANLDGADVNILVGEAAEEVRA